MGITAATVSSANIPEELSLPSAPRDPRVGRTLALMAVLVGVAVVGALTHLGSVVIGVAERIGRTRTPLKFP